MERFIEIKNARVNNLKNISIKIPKGKITIFTGVSGSGKSSIVFDTIAEEAGRQLNETYDSFVRLFLPRFKRPNVDSIKNLSTAIVVNQKKIGGNSRSTLGTITDVNSFLRILYSRFASPRVGDGYANSYSFNDPEGMCRTCEGIGKTIALNIKTIIDKDKSLNEGAILLPGYKIDSYYWKSYAEIGFFDNDKKIKDYSEEEFEKLMYGETEKVVITLKGIDHNSNYEGLATRFMRTNINKEKEVTERSRKSMEEFTIMESCPDCKGKRYNKEVLNSKINGYSIYDLTSFELKDLIKILEEIKIEDGAIVIDGIKERVKNLIDIGLSYMTLDRETNSLSGGESQRVKMVKHLSSSLTGLIYIFDEPSTGLHPRDVYRLNNLLIKLRDDGNTVLVVEHDPDVINIADYIVDIGPKAGSYGGEITYTGDYAGLLKSNTLTGNYLSKELPIKKNPRIAKEFLVSEKSSLHNLKDVSLRIPKGVFTCVTGVAGSGKTTLVSKVFLEEYKDAIYIDQSPIHTSKRSNPATITGIMDHIRKAFANENKQSPGLFSFNSIGKCETCNGSGVIELNLSYMDKTQVECSVCKGTRYKKEVLSYLYKGKNIVDVMDMTIEDANNFFDIEQINKRLESLLMVGLSYLVIGQPLDTISGGEAQRLKLAKELSTDGNIFILDEPTTGLHMSDVANVVKIIDGLVEKKNTVIVIEHNIHVIRSSDWIIDLGPDGGTGGGEIIFEGVPSELSSCKESMTGKYI